MKVPCIEKPLLFVYLIILSASGAEIISGRAIDTLFSPLSGVQVLLINQQIGDTTDDDGIFELEVPSTFIRTDRTTALPELSFQKNRINFVLPAPQTVSVDLFSVTGKRIATIAKHDVYAGRQSVALHDRIRTLASGLYLVQCTFDAVSARITVTIAGGRISAASGYNPTTGISKENMLARSGDAGDTLVLSKYGYVTERVPLEDLWTQDLGDIMLAYAYWEARIMSFNIRGPVDPYPNSWSDRKSRVFTVINTYKPDFLGFQELIPGYLDDIADSCPDYSRYGRGRDADGGDESCMIYYLTDTWQIDSSNAGTFWLSDTPDDPGSIGWGASLPRICTHARFINSTTDAAVYIYNTHFDYQYTQVQYNSAVLIADSIAARAYTETPFVLTGDFNASENSSPVLYLKQDSNNPVHMTDPYRILYPNDNNAGTFHDFTGYAGSSKIDYILSLKDSYQALEAEIVRYRDDLGLYPSDHFPVYALMKFPFILITY